MVRKVVDVVVNYQILGNPFIRSKLFSRIEYQHTEFLMILSVRFPDTNSAQIGSLGAVKKVYRSI